MTRLEELRAAAEAEAGRAAEDAERVQRESLEAVADIKGVLEKERARARRQKATFEGADGSRYALEVRVPATMRERLACAERAARPVVKRRVKNLVIFGASETGK